MDLHAYTRGRIALMLLGFLGIVEILTLLIYSSPYPTVFSRYSSRHFYFLLFHIGFVSLLFILAGVPNFTIGIMKHISDFRDGPLYVRILGIIIYFLALLGYINVLSRIPHPTLIWVSTALGICTASIWCVLIQPTESRLQRYFILYSLLLSLACVEGFVYFISQQHFVVAQQTSSSQARLLDYPELFVPGWPAGWNKSPPEILPEGGLFRPSLRIDILGERGPVRFITNSKGFRNAQEFSYTVPPDIFRILYIGDSFAAGYRVGQNEMSGKIMEEALNSLLRNTSSMYKQVEVLVACIDEPATGWLWLQEHGFKYNPNLVVLGAYWGNDIFQSYLAIAPHGLYQIQKDGEIPVIVRNHETTSRIGFTTPPLNTLYLPETAQFLSASRMWRVLRYHSTVVDLLSQSYLSQRFAKLVFLSSPNTVISFYGDHSRDYRLHAFDPFHDLGLYYIPTLDPVDEAFNRFHSILRGIQTACRSHNTAFLVSLFSPSPQVVKVIWETMIEQYSLKPDYFDLEYPNRRIIQQCMTDGIQCFDLLQSFRAVAIQPQEWLYLQNDGHWNNRGHQVAGQAIAQYIWDSYLDGITTK